jgi:hypothetical protein
MVVRIRVTRVQRTAILFSALLTPAALMAGALGGWRLMAGLEWTNDFAIRDGLFSHWQVWAAIAIGVQFLAFLLGRLAGSRGQDAQPSSRPRNVRDQRCV